MPEPAVDLTTLVGDRARSLDVELAKKPLVQRSRVAIEGGDWQRVWLLPRAGDAGFVLLHPVDMVKSSIAGAAPGYVAKWFDEGRASATTKRSIGSSLGSALTTEDDVLWLFERAWEPVRVLGVEVTPPPGGAFMLRVEPSGAAKAQTLPDELSAQGFGAEGPKRGAAWPDVVSEVRRREGDVDVEVRSLVTLGEGAVVVERRELPGQWPSAASGGSLLVESPGGVALLRDGVLAVRVKSQARVLRATLTRSGDLVVYAASSETESGTQEIVLARVGADGALRWAYRSSAAPPCTDGTCGGFYPRLVPTPEDGVMLLGTGAAAPVGMRGASEDLRTMLEVDATGEIVAVSSFDLRTGCAPLQFATVHETAIATRGELVVAQYCTSTRIGTCVNSTNPDCSPFSGQDAVLARYARPAR